MKKRMWIRLLSAVLSLIICVTVFPAPSAVAVTALRYGDVPIWIGDAMVDYQAEQILKEIPTKGKSKKEQVRAVYTWVVRNCKRDNWDGTYYFDEDEVYEKSGSAFAEQANEALRSGKLLLRTEYISDDTSDDNFFFIAPDSNVYITTFAYDMMLTRTGTCAHYAALLCVLLGHLGFDCRLIDGEFLNRDGTRVEHKWNYVLVDGKYYWLDPRIENANYERTGSVDYIYFMKDDTSAWAKSHEWDHTYSDWLAANASSIISDYNNILETAANTVYHNVTALASRSGEVSGADVYAEGETATLTASSESGKKFIGWYDENGKFLIDRTTYSFTVTKSTTVYAMFEGDLFYDLKNQWYVDRAVQAANLGFISGTGPFKFDGDVPMNRGMAVVMLAKIDGVNLQDYKTNRFADVKEGAWYNSAVAWAYDNNIVSGASASAFEPERSITRQEFMTMMVTYLNYKEAKMTAAKLNYTDADKIAGWAYPNVELAQGAGLTTGYPDGTFRPYGSLTRAEGVTILLNLIDFLKKAA